MKSNRSLFSHSDAKSSAGGAVMVEFLIAYLPVLVAFLMFWQLGELLVAQMIVERASSAAGRAAIVVLPDDPAFYDAQPAGQFEGERKREIRLAAGMMLAASPHLSENFTVDISNVPAGDDDVAEITVKVDAEFHCKRLTWVCGADGIALLSSSSQHTYHGANYDYEPTDIANLGQSDTSSAENPGCSDNGTPNSGKGGNGNGNGNGKPDNGGSCPPGQSALKDGTCGNSRGNGRCKDGSTVAPDGLCHDGTCPKTGRKPEPGANPQDPCEPDGGGSGGNGGQGGRGVQGGRGGNGGQGGSGGQGGRGGNGGQGGSGGKPDCNDPTKNGGGRKSLPSNCGKCRFVYRRDTRPPSEIFKSGFTSKGSNYNLSDFVVGADEKSSFISTTSDENIALQLSWQANDQLSWKNNGAPQPNTDYIYKIRDCGSGVDVNSTLDPNSCSESATADKIRRYKYQKEIVVPGKIDANDIVAVIEPRESDRPPAPPQPKGGKPFTPAQQQAFTHWPPLSDVQNHATPLPNVGYSPGDDAKRTTQCKKEAGQ